MSFIQKTTVGLNGVNSTAATPSLTGVVAGNTLVWITSTYQTLDKVPTDSSGQTWVKGAYETVLSHASDVGIYYLLNANAGTHTLSWLVGDAPNDGYLWGTLVECPKSSGLDVAGGGTAIGTGNPTTISTTVTTSAASTFAVAGMAIGSASGNSNCAITTPTGWTQISVENDSSSAQAAEHSYKEQTSAGLQTATWNFLADPSSATAGAIAVSFVNTSGGSGGTSTAAESSAGTEASDRTLALTAPATETSAGTTAQDASVAAGGGTSTAAETSAGTTAQNATVALTGASTETSAGTTAQNATVVVTAGVTETSSGTDSSDRSITLTTGVAETSAGTTAQDAPSATSGTFGTLETSAGTDATNRTVALGGGTGESSAGTTAQNATTAVTAAVSETSASSTSQNATVSLAGAVNETSAGTDAADQSGIQTSAVAETSAGTTAQNFSIGTISRGVTETSAGTTSQDGTVPPPVGSGSNGLRRWLIQQYTDYFDKRDKDKALALIAKDIQTVSAGVVTPKMIRERAPQPVVNQTAALAAAERQRQNEVWQKHLQEQQDALLNAQMALANMPDMNAMDLQHRIEQGEEEDLLLLTSVL